MKARELLKNWLRISYRIAGCNAKDCIVCQENDKIIKDTKEYLDKTKEEA